MADIKISQEVFLAKITHIKNYINALSKISVKYDSLIASLTASECENKNSVLLLLNQEKNTLLAMVDLYNETVRMLSDMVIQLYTVEDTFDKNRVY